MKVKSLRGFSSFSEELTHLMQEAEPVWRPYFEALHDVISVFEGSILLERIGGFMNHKRPPKLSLLGPASSIQLWPDYYDRVPAQESTRDALHFRMTYKPLGHRHTIEVRTRDPSEVVRHVRIALDLQY